MPVTPDCSDSRFDRPTYRRFERVAISSVSGDPLHPATWSGAPYNLGQALRRLGVSVEGLRPRISTGRKVALGLRHVLGGYGRLRTSDQLQRSEPARRSLAGWIERQSAERGLRHIIHTGTLDLPVAATEVAAGHGRRVNDMRRPRHYLYCDHTWALASRHNPDIADYTGRARAEFERLEHRSLHSVDHVFTFSNYVREHIVEHYGLPPERVSVAGSGMGQITPFLGHKNYARPALLFVSKHLFREKGGPLLVQAFLLALQQRPDLLLTIVAAPGSRHLVPEHPQITVVSELSWAELYTLYQDATLLVQPMLNDPWGQVYLEALACRTPVLGLDRNGLPEITGNGSYGFLAESARPEALAAHILDALTDIRRLEYMGTAGQQHVLSSYSWDLVARKILRTDNPEY